MTPLRWACPLGCEAGYINIPQLNEHLKKSHVLNRKAGTDITAISSEKMEEIRGIMKGYRLKADGTKARLIYEALNPGVDILDAPIYAPTREQVFSSAEAVAKGHPRSTALRSKFKNLAMNDSWFSSLSPSNQEAALRVTCALLPFFHKAVTIMGIVTVPSATEESFFLQNFEPDLATPPPIMMHEKFRCPCGRLVPPDTSAIIDSEIPPASMALGKKADSNSSGGRPDTSKCLVTSTKRSANDLFEESSIKRLVHDRSLTSILPSLDSGEGHAVQNPPDSSRTLKGTSSENALGQATRAVFGDEPKMHEFPCAEPKFASFPSTEVWEPMQDLQQLERFRAASKSKEVGWMLGGPLTASTDAEHAEVSYSPSPLPSKVQDPNIDAEDQSSTGHCDMVGKNRARSLQVSTQGRAGRQEKNRATISGTEVKDEISTTGWADWTIDPQTLFSLGVNLLPESTAYGSVVPNGMLESRNSHRGLSKESPGDMLCGTRIVDMDLFVPELASPDVLNAELDPFGLGGQ